MSNKYKKMNHWITKEEEELMIAVVEASTFKNRGELIRDMLMNRAVDLGVPVPEGFRIRVPIVRAPR